MLFLIGLRSSYALEPNKLPYLPNMHGVHIAVPYCQRLGSVNHILRLYIKNLTCLLMNKYAL